MAHISIRAVDLHASLVHLRREHLIAFGLFDLIKCFSLLVEEPQHVVQPGPGNAWPADDFRPIRHAPPMVEGRDWIAIVDVLQLLLSRQCLLDQVRMETTETEDKYAEDGGDKAGDNTEPVCLKSLAKDFYTRHIWILFLNDIVVDHQVCDAHGHEQDYSRGQVENKYVEQTAPKHKDREVRAAAI